MHKNSSWTCAQTNYVCCVVTHIRDDFYTLPCHTLELAKVSKLLISVGDLTELTGKTMSDLDIHCVSKKTGPLLHFQITPTILSQYQQILVQRIVN